LAREPAHGGVFDDRSPERAPTRDTRELSRFAMRRVQGDQQRLGSRRSDNEQKMETRPSDRNGRRKTGAPPELVPRIVTTRMTGNRVRNEPALHARENKQR
jgi:hypothetical protein